MTSAPSRRNTKLTSAWETQRCSCSHYYVVVRTSCCCMLRACHKRKRLCARACNALTGLQPLEPSVKNISTYTNADMGVPLSGFFHLCFDTA